MRQICSRGRKHDLQIGGHLDLARAQPVIADRKPANLRIVFG